MKKFYAVAAFMLCAIVAFAMPKTQSAKVSDISMEKLQKVQFSALNDVEYASAYSPIRHKYTDSKGVEWQLTLNPWMGMWDVFTSATFQKYPFMLVTVQLSNSDGNTYAYLATWPTKACAKEYILTDNPDYDFDTAKAIADLGEDVAKSPMSIPEAMQAKNDFEGEEDDYWVVATNADEEGYVSWNWFGCVCPDFCDMVGFDGTVNGKSAYTGSGEEGYFQLKTFDPSTQVANVVFQAVMYDAPRDGNALGNLYCDYNGSLVAIGFAHIQKEITFSEVHVFNVGTLDYETDPYGYCFLEEFDPVTMFYMAACGSSFVIDMPGQPGTPAATTSGRVAYDATTLPLLPSGNDKYGLPFFYGDDESGMVYYRGAFYAAEDAGENGYQAKFVLPADFEWDYELTAGGSVSGVLNTPVVGQFIPGGYTYGACDYAVRGMALYPYFSFPEIGKASEFGFGGDKGFWGNIEDSQNMNVTWSFTGDMVYHYDPTDFLKFRMVDATEGDDAVKALFGDNANVVSTQYYNLQGVRLSAAPVKGAYIVRNTLSNGNVVAKKVVK